MNEIVVERMTCARIPTDVGRFTLCLYRNNLDDKEHLALLVGDPAGQPDVLVRVHSECFTGDVLGSLRCDCGMQLDMAMRLIAEEGLGVILYLRQEGRGIGLLDKLRAYNLQDVGYDTVDANLMLGHQPDLRDYTIAALILKDLGVTSLRLLTNNPDKIEGLQRAGLTVAARLPLQTGVSDENVGYLNTKMRRMRHLLNLDGLGANQGLVGDHANGTSRLSPAGTDGSLESVFEELIVPPPPLSSRPYVTLSYAQSLDGSIAARRGQTTPISGPEALQLTHRLRARHDAILVGIGTVLADDPQLNVRLAEGRDPQPIVVDSRLRFPPAARLLNGGPRPPWVATTTDADPSRQRELEAMGARVLRLPTNAQGRVDLFALLEQLGRMGIGSVMVEGGASIITSFLSLHLVDRLVLTIAPLLLGGLTAVNNLGQLNGRIFPYLRRPEYRTLGKDVILVGELAWE